MRKSSRSWFLAVFITSFLFVAVSTINLIFAHPAVDGLRSQKITEDQLGQQREIREEVKEKIATKTAQLREEQVGRLKKFFARILDRFEAALARLERITGKLERRIEKLADRGVETSTAKSALERCQDKRLAAKQAIEQSRSNIEAVDANSTNVRETVRTSVEAIHSAKKAVREYHKCLVEVTRMLKVANQKEGTGDGQ